MVSIEWMVALKVFRLQTTAKALFKAADTQASAIRLHSRRCPYVVAHGIDFRVGSYALLNALAFVAVALVKGHLHLDPGRKSGRSVEPAVDAKMML
jgi:hypothetical protein